MAVVAMAVVAMAASSPPPTTEVFVCSAESGRGPDSAPIMGWSLATPSRTPVAVAVAVAVAD